MPRRILLADAPGPLATAFRRDLEGTGLRVDAVPPAEAVASLDPDRHVAAVVRGGAGAAAVVKALRAVDPRLPVIALFADAEEAAGHPDALSADGALVGPLTAPAVAGACRLAERLHAEGRRVSELEAELTRRARADAGLELMKKLLLLEVKRSRRYGHPLALAVVGVDRWPEVEAKLGIRGAAPFLGEVLGVLAGQLRDIDLAVPFAGERFVVLMPHTRGAGGLTVARRLCARIRAHAGPVRVTASAGVCSHPGGGSVSFGALVKRAAEALARARSAGGDRAELSDPPRRDRISMG
jgi:two-component system, cell cycle response regulator